MSVFLVEKTIEKFILNKKPEIICIKGNWGVGKTYFWKKCIEKFCSIESYSGLESYAYVSLFGISSLKDLKITIFENTTSTKNLKIGPSVSNINERMKDTIFSVKKNTSMIANIPIIKNITGENLSAFFLTVRDQVICIDDLERRGSGVGISEILGIANYLKEERNCKIVLLTNYNSLKNEDMEEFNKISEKIFDYVINYDPSICEILDVAISNDDYISKVLLEKSKILNIKNIRVIRRIDAIIRNILCDLNDCHDRTKEEACVSIILYSYAYLDSESGLDAEFIENFNTFAQDNDVDEVKASWYSLLREYGYAFTDEFDQMLFESIKNGYINVEKHEKIINDKNFNNTHKDANDNFESAWRLFHDTFDNNEHELIDRMSKSFRENSNYISPLNLNGMVELLRYLDNNELADELIDYYIENWSGDPGVFDLNNYGFSGDVTDDAIKEKFMQKCSEQENGYDIVELILSIKNNYDEKVIEMISNQSVDELYKMLKSHEGYMLNRLISSLLEGDRISNASPALKAVANNAKEALKLIGRESRLNARRVKRLGINLD